MSDVTRMRPGDGPTWLDSPYAADNSQRLAQGASASRAEVNDHGSKTMSIIALILSGGAVVGLIIAAILMPALIGAIVEKGNAEVRASLQQQIAQAQATAQAGKEHARIALDEVQRSNAQLEAKGLIRPAIH